MRRLKASPCSLLPALAIALLLLCGCQTKPEPSVTGTVRTPDVIYGNPGQKK